MAKSKKQESQEAPAETPAKAAKAKAKPEVAAAAAPEAAAKPKRATTKKAEPAPAAAKATPAASKPAAPAVGAKPAFPAIDTSLAAKAAANLLVNRDLLGVAASPAKPEQKVESGSFRNLKQSLNQPTAGLNKALGIPGISGKKGPQAFGTFGGGGPRGQSAGGDAAKVGVPRRTNG